METISTHQREQISRPDYSGIAADIAGQNFEIGKYRDCTIAAARYTIDAVICLGEKLIELRETLAGEFDAWLETYHESLPDFPSRATCYNYMRATRYKVALGDEAPELASLKELFIAAGILPPPEKTDDTGPRPPQPLFRLKFNLATPDPKEWEPMDRREFLRQAKPVVDLYERVAAAEKA